MGQVLIVISTAVSALAALSIAVLTFFLVRATNRYVKETTKYVCLVQEQLGLLRAQLAAPLLLDVDLFPGTPLQLFARCRHSGNPSSLSAIIKGVTLRIHAVGGGEETLALDDQHFDDVLNPGKAWRKPVGPKVAAKIAGLRPPELWRALLHGGPWHQAAGGLSVTLRFQRAGQAEFEEVTRDYEVRTRALGGPVRVKVD
jgi:hypothetical protein